MLHIPCLLKCIGLFKDRRITPDLFWRCNLSAEGHRIKGFSKCLSSTRGLTSKRIIFADVGLFNVALKSSVKSKENNTHLAPCDLFLGTCQLLHFTSCFSYVFFSFKNRIPRYPRWAFSKLSITTQSCMYNKG